MTSEIAVFLRECIAEIRDANVCSDAWIKLAAKGEVSITKAAINMIRCNNRITLALKILQEEGY